MLPVYVMIGGGSSRFGQDKATYPVDGEPWAMHVGRRLAASLDQITLVGGASVPHELASLRWIADQPPQVGPLAGLMGAIVDRQQRLGPGLLVLASCDLVQPSRDDLAPLLATFADTQQLHVAAYRAADRWQPFPAVLHTLCQQRLATLIAEGVTSLQAVFTALESQAVPWPGDANGPPQANTLLELQRWRQ